MSNKSTNKTQSRLDEEIIEMATGLHRIGIMDDAAYNRITMRHLDKESLPAAEPISPEDIRNVREKEHISQAVLASYLNLTVGYVSQLERGTKQPKGPALVLLNVIRRKGLAAIQM